MLQNSTGLPEHGKNYKQIVQNGIGFFSTLRIGSSINEHEKCKIPSTPTVMYAIVEMEMLAMQPGSQQVRVRYFLISIVRDPWKRYVKTKYEITPSNGR